ncbi:MAG: TlpA disulfide reductase family protein [Candidatus Kapabacteria bacterium]|nr:TlpA disulfide reductase family protein [Candidatus Kapabacteria bacterium]
MKKIIILVLAMLLNASIIFSQAKELKIGDIASEISLSNTNGKIIKLSSLRGKMVLIDFWASWCAPCVKEQPLLANLYKKYKSSLFTVGKGFEIYGVSFDNKRSSWESIIKKYKINWIQVSDLKFWSSPVAKLYNLQELPYNILIDGEGIIIAKNLHGEELERTIKKYLK